MNIEILYKNLFGRFVVQLLKRTGAFKLVNYFLKCNISRKFIKGYIERHQINMHDFKGQYYKSFAEFFARKKDVVSCILNPKVLISPCDGLVSIYPITEDLNILMKGSNYRLIDLIPEKTVSEQLMGGICLVFRLQAFDYHHFCAFDEAIIKTVNYIPGELHSVKPIVCEKIPVYKLNRRWWSLLYTAHFGNVVQIEVGAMLVGGVHFVKEYGCIYRGNEMGNFELAGSTIILMLSSKVRELLSFESKFSDAFYGKVEIPVSIGEGIGSLTDSKEYDGNQGCNS